jgi:hypothetical protein
VVSKSSTRVFAFKFVKHLIHRSTLAFASLRQAAADAGCGVQWTGDVPIRHIGKHGLDSTLLAHGAIIDWQIGIERRALKNTTKWTAVSTAKLDCY